MANRIIEIHDSVLEKISLSQGKAELHFSSVYIHRSEGRPGIDAGSGWVQRAILRIDGAELRGTFPEFPVDLANGQIKLGEHCTENEIPIPLCYKGTFELRLEPKWQSQEVMTFTGRGAELELIGEPEYVEEFRPDELR